MKINLLSSTAAQPVSGEMSQKISSQAFFSDSLTAMQENGETKGFSVFNSIASGFKAIYLTILNFLTCNRKVHSYTVARLFNDVEEDLNIRGNTKYRLYLIKCGNSTLEIDTSDAKIIQSILKWSDQLPLEDRYEALSVTGCTMVSGGLLRGDQVDFVTTRRDIKGLRDRWHDSYRDVLEMKAVVDAITTAERFNALKNLKPILRKRLY